MGAIRASRACCSSSPSQATSTVVPVPRPAARIIMMDLALTGAESLSTFLMVTLDWYFLASVTKRDAGRA